MFVRERVLHQLPFRKQEHIPTDVDGTRPPSLRLTHLVALADAAHPVFADVAPG